MQLANLQQLQQRYKQFSWLGLSNLLKLQKPESMIFTLKAWVKGLKATQVTFFQLFGYFGKIITNVYRESCDFIQSNSKLMWSPVISSVRNTRWYIKTEKGSCHEPVNRHVPRIRDITWEGELYRHLSTITLVSKHRCLTLSCNIVIIKLLLTK